MKPIGNAFANIVLFIKTRFIYLILLNRSGALYPEISDIRSIDLGYLCHYPVDLEDPSANTVSPEKKN